MSYNNKTFNNENKKLKIFHSVDSGSTSSSSASYTNRQSSNIEILNEIDNKDKPLSSSRSSSLSNDKSSPGSLNGSLEYNLDNNERVNLSLFKYTSNHLINCWDNNSTSKEPATKSTNSIWTYYIENAQTYECFQKKIELKEALQEMLVDIFPYLGIYIVGSSANGFGTDKSDVDICLVISHEEITQKTEALWILKLIGNALRKTQFVEYLRVINAKVPIIKFKDSVNNIECDINLNNHIGIRNTHLMKCYSELDWRVKPLILNIKRWAKYHDINDASRQTLSSYSLSLMAIYFMQQLSPPVLPVLQDIQKEKFSIDSDIRHLKLIDEHIDWTSSNNQTLGDLFGQFLSFYANQVNFEFNVISVREGKIINKNFLPRIEGNNEWKYILIEEPFDLTNTSRAVFDYAIYTKIKHVFKQSDETYRKTLNIQDILTEKYYDADEYHSQAYRYNKKRYYQDFSEYDDLSD